MEETFTKLNKLTKWYFKKKSILGNLIREKRVKKIKYDLLAI